MKRFGNSGYVAAMLMAGAVGLSSAFGAGYQVTDLGTFGGTGSRANAINSAGDVVGYATVANGDQHAFLYHAGVMQDLGMLGGVKALAMSVNDNGDVLVASFTSLFPDPVAQSYVRHLDGTVTALPSPATNPTFYNTINNNGDAAGQYMPDGTFSLRGAIYRAAGGTAVDANSVISGVPVGSVVDNVEAMNDHGVITGSTFNGQENAFIWSGGQLIRPMPLGPSVGSSDVSALNENGDVAGYFYAPGSGSPEGYAYIGGFTEVLTLPGFQSLANGINDSGDVVGDYFTGNVTSAVQHAFIYSNGVGEDLNDLIPAGSGWDLEQANGINDAGEIVGYGTIGGQEHAFLLTAVPEPGTVLVLGVGGVMMWRRRR